MKTDNVKKERKKNVNVKEKKEGVLKVSCESCDVDVIRIQ